MTAQELGLTVREVSNKDVERINSSNELSIAWLHEFFISTLLSYHCVDGLSDSSHHVRAWELKYEISLLMCCLLDAYKVL